MTAGHKFLTLTFIADLRSEITLSTSSTPLTAQNLDSIDPTSIHWLGRVVVDQISSVGDLFTFFWKLCRCLMTRLPRSRVLWPILYEVGVQSVPVVCVTGLFIGMVLAVQSYDTLSQLHFQSQIGSVINGTLVKELGPVLAAVMLAGRVGSSIAAEIGTMKVSEQIDALKALGADPIGSSPREFSAFLVEQNEKFRKLVDAAGLRNK